MNTQATNGSTVFSRLRQELLFVSRAVARDGVLCERIVNKLQQNERAPAVRLEEWRNKFLLRTLKTATSKLAAYQNIKVNCDSGDVLDVLQNNFPVVSKEDLLSSPALFYPKGGKRYPWSIIGRTSGTTGTPLHVIRSSGSVLWANAAKKRHWRWSGFAEGMPRASLRGDMIVSADKVTPPFWFYNRHNNQLLLSSRHLKPAFIDLIADELSKFSPYLLEAYPSTAYELALHLLRSGPELKIPYVYTGSEVLYPHQRDAIEKAFYGRIMDHYGMAERVAYATECEQGNMHVNTDYSYVEIIDENGRPTEADGYIAGTTFHNLVMPLVRYRLSDHTKWKRGSCACGRSYPMIEPVVGKVEDVIYGSDGSVVSPSVITFAFKELRHVRQSQVAQVGPGRWQIRVVPMQGFDEAERNRIIDNVRRLVDAKLVVSVALLDEIPRTETGKYRWVVNEYKKIVPDQRSVTR